MDKNCKVLIPMMMDIHFDLIAGVLRNEGYDVEVLKTDHRGVIEEGLKSVHNDMCYPALLVIGQFIDALKSGKYDTKNFLFHLKVISIFFIVFYMVIF